MAKLSEENWFVLQTNTDWDKPDSRQLRAEEVMTELGQDAVTLDGVSIIESVLWDHGVCQANTLFTSTISANQMQPMVVYIPPPWDFDVMQLMLTNFSIGMIGF